MKLLLTSDCSQTSRGNQLKIAATFRITVVLGLSTTTEQAFVPGHLSRQPFVPVGATNRDKRPPYCPGWCLQPGQNSLALLSPSLSPRPSHLAHLFLLFLARERGVLAHFFTTFVKIFDSPSIGAKGLELVFLFLLGLYSSFHALEIEKMCSQLISWTFRLHMQV